jgi:Fe-S cluster assembly ATP-binding protein
MNNDDKRNDSSPKAPLLQIEDLHASVDGKPILNGVDLTLPAGEVHALMGPNGSGKSTLANVLMGHPGYEVTSGRILLAGEELTELAPDERARRGLFLAFQYPVEVPGLSTLNFLRNAMGAVQGKPVPVRAFRKQVDQTLDGLGLERAFARRALNEGFSGGEKKRNEVLQMSLLQPRLAVLDEPDSGLDVDGIRQVAAAINAQRDAGSGVLVITHYMRILEHLDPDRVHVLFGGQVLKSGGPEIARELEEQGYGLLRDGLTTTSHPLVPEEA